MVTLHYIKPLISRNILSTTMLKSDHLDSTMGIERIGIVVELSHYTKFMFSLWYRHQPIT